MPLVIAHGLPGFGWIVAFVAMLLVLVYGPPVAAHICRKKKKVVAAIGLATIGIGSGIGGCVLAEGWFFIWLGLFPLIASLLILTLAVSDSRKRPNQALQPTPMLVTDRADARSAPSTGVADL